MSNVKPPYCGECRFFLYEDADGRGYCNIRKETQYCVETCVFADDEMTNRNTERILHYYQKWRRGEKGNMPHPWLIGAAIDNSIKIIRNTKQHE